MHGSDRLARVGTFWICPQDRNIDYVRGTVAMIEAKMTRVIGMTRMEPGKLQEETQVHFPAPQR